MFWARFIVVPGPASKEFSVITPFLGPKVLHFGPTGGKPPYFALIFDQFVPKWVLRKLCD